MAPPNYSDILHSPCFPQPWDDPEDHAGLFIWLGAIDSGDMRLLARYLRHCSPWDKRVLVALADKLNPPTNTASRYIWRRDRGRPLRRLKGLEDPIEVVLAEGDLAFIADHLKTSANPDPRVISWLADQMDPDQGHSHFEFKQARVGDCAAASLAIRSSMILGGCFWEPGSPSCIDSTASWKPR